MYKICFVILHYITKNETIKCIESIIDRIDTDNYEIVVVDNKSTNNSGIELIEKYKNNGKIHILRNKENLGFAKGNNEGIRYVKNNLKSDFIVVMNNDTYLIQDDFTKVIYNEYTRSKFGVMGPKIKLLNNKINIVNNKLITADRLRIQLIELRIKLVLNDIYLDRVYKYISESIKKILRRKKIRQNHNDADANSRQENVILHGCCLIFSPVYLKKFDGFDDRTFLYYEEELLFIKVRQAELITVYNPELMIFHSEDAATNAINKSKRHIRKFVYENLLESGKVLYNELNITN